MATLTSAQLDDVYAQFMRENTEDLSVEKADLRQAFAEMDAHVEAATDAAFGLPSMSTFTEQQKTDIVHRIIKRRLEVLRGT